MVDYDIATAGHMLETGRNIYVVFMCHLAIEKMLKAIISEATGAMPPITHNLIYLVKLAEVHPPQPLNDFIAIISNASVPTRYPSDFAKLIEAYPKDVVADYLNKTREVLKWLKEYPILKR